MWLARSALTWAEASNQILKYKMSVAYASNNGWLVGAALHLLIARLLPLVPQILRKFSARQVI
jgi:hypothetical protein